MDSFLATHNGRLDRNGDSSIRSATFCSYPIAKLAGTQSCLKLGQLRNVPPRSFYGPGINNCDCDLTLTKPLCLTESKSFEFRHGI
jgi:hypothetical protein